MATRVTFEEAYEHARKHEAYLKTTKDSSFGEGFMLYEQIRNPGWHEPFRRRAAFIKSLPRVMAHIDEWSKSKRPVSDAYIEKFKQIPWIKDPNRFMTKRRK